MNINLRQSPTQEQQQSPTQQQLPTRKKQPQKKQPQQQKKKQQQQQQQPPPQQQQLRRRHQTDRVHCNFTHVGLFGMADEEVKRRFRLPPHVIMETLEIVQSDLEGNLQSHTAIPPLTRLLVVLQFCASGSFQKSMGSTTGMSQSSFSRVLRVVLRAFLSRRNQFINLPLDEESVVSIKKQFAAIAGFPHVIGAVDATHIPLVPRGRNTFIFINKKNFSSLNVQVICDSTLLIRSVVAKYPGSAQDSFVMRHSAIWQKLDQRHRQGGGDAWLLGDSAYPLRPFLLTPILNPTTEQHVAYNTAHSATRQVVERSVGLLKARFKCLDQSGGALMYAPDIVCDIFVLCCIFHNIAVRSGAPMEDEVPVAADDDEEEVDEDDDDDEDEDDDDDSPTMHSNFRAYVLEKYFSYIPRYGHQPLLADIWTRVAEVQRQNQTINILRIYRSYYTAE